MPAGSRDQKQRYRQWLEARRPLPGSGESGVTHSALWGCLVLRETLSSAQLRGRHKRRLCRLRPAEGSLEAVRPPGDLATPQAPCQRPGSVGCGRPWSPEPSDLSLPEPGSGAQGHPERCGQAAALGQLQSQECEGLGPGNQITQEKRQSPTHTEILLYKQHVTSV